MKYIKISTLKKILFFLGLIILIIAFYKYSNKHYKKLKKQQNINKSFIVVSPEPIGINEFLKSSIRGVKEAGILYKLPVRVFESKNPSVIYEQVNAAVQDKPKIIIVLGFQFVDIVDYFSKKFYNQKFLIIDACTKERRPNVYCAIFREHEAVYLAGYEAAILSKNNHVGTISAIDTPQMRKFVTPFFDGAKAAKSNIKFTSLFVGGLNPFSDPVRAKEQTYILINKGVDIILASSAAGNFGIFDAVKEKNIKVIGVDTNQCHIAPGFVLDNVIKQVEFVVKDTIKSIIEEPKNNENIKSYGLLELGVTLTGLSDTALSDCIVLNEKSTIDKLKNVKEEIIKKKVIVNDPSKS